MPSGDPRDLRRRLSLFSAILFAMPGIFLPYWPLWLRGRGLDDESIGLLLAAGVWTRLVIAPMVARAADTRIEHRDLLALLGVLVFAGFALHIGATSMPALFALSIVCGSLFAAIMPLTDSLTLLCASAHDLEYGEIRRWGSVAFVLTTLGAGVLIRGHSPERVLYLLLVPLGIFALATRILPRAPRAPSERKGPSPPFWSLLRVPWFALFLAVGALIYASHGMLNGFSSLHWKSLGIEEDTIGVLWVVGVVAEIAVFSAGAVLLRRLRPLQIATFAAIACVIRWVGLSVAVDLPTILALQALHGLTFGAVHFAAMHVIHRGMPAQLSATAQSLFAAASGGLGFGGGYWIAGRLYASVGAQGYLAMAGLAAAAVGLLVLLDRRWPDPRADAPGDA
ncbi:MAG: MFS transporter [Nannocystaceae bacterium]